MHLVPEGSKAHLRLLVARGHYSSPPRRTLALGHRPRTRIREAKPDPAAYPLLSRTGHRRRSRANFLQLPYTLFDLTSLTLPPSLLHTHTPPPPPPNTATLYHLRLSLLPKHRRGRGTTPSRLLYHRARFVVRVSHDPATTERNALDTASAVAPQSAPLSCNLLQGTSPIRAPRPADCTLATSSQRPYRPRRFQRKHPSRFAGRHSSTSQLISSIGPGGSVYGKHVLRRRQEWGRSRCEKEQGDRKAAP